MLRPRIKVVALEAVPQEPIGALAIVGLIILAIIGLGLFPAAS